MIKSNSLAEGLSAGSVMESALEPSSDSFLCATLPTGTRAVLQVGLSSIGNRHSAQKWGEAEEVTFEFSAMKTFIESLFDIPLTTLKEFIGAADV